MFNSNHDDAADVAVANKFPFRLFLLLFTPVALLILAGGWYVGKERVNEEMSMLQTVEIGNVVMGVRRLDDELHLPLRQLRILASEADLARAVESGSASDLQAMQAIFANLITYTNSYEKIRWLDASGLERVRINNVEGKPQSVAEADLQPLADSYYFKQGMTLKPGEVFISPMDLNIERGQIESPYKPMLRLVMPMFAADGNRRGVLVLNVDARKILNNFTDSLMEARDHAMLLNSEGYWLKNPDSNLEWGFMLPHKASLSASFPEAWKAISEIPSGQVELADGLWTWSTVYPLKVDDSRDAKGIPTWLVVTHLSSEQMTPLRQSAWRSVGIYVISLLVLYGVIAAWLARAVVGRAAAVANVAKAKAEAEAAKAVHQAQERFRLVVEANTNGLLAADKNGRIVLVNPALANMFGYAREELLGQPLEILLPESAAPMHAQHFATFIRNPVSRPMGSGRELYGRHKNGSQFSIEISLSPFYENGEIFVDAFVADISERKRSELLHRRIEARLQLMMQTNPNGLLVVDDHGAIEMANPALERMFGYAPGELFNRSLEQLLPKESRVRHADLRQHYLANPSIRSMGAGLDLFGIRKDGSTIEVEVSLASFEEEGRRYVQATVIEASNRKPAAT